jgi:hypothetical protein
MRPRYTWLQNDNRRGGVHANGNLERRRAAGRMRLYIGDRAGEEGQLDQAGVRSVVWGRISCPPVVKHFYSRALLRMAYEAARRADASAAAAPDNSTDDALVTIVLAASAAECFLNDLVGTIQFLAGIEAKHWNGDMPRLAAIAEVLDMMEAERSQARSKYLTAAALLGCDAICKGKQPFQSFDDLFVLRNAIVHARPVSPADQDRPARIAASLAQRGIANRSSVASKLMDADTWWMQIRTAATARWAAESANAIMLPLAVSAAAIADVQNALGSLVTNLRPKPAD